jgi:hypothetical protein
VAERPSAHSVSAKVSLTGTTRSLFQQERLRERHQQSLSLFFFWFYLAAL